jgi:hypothetical protein
MLLRQLLGLLCAVVVLLGPATAWAGGEFGSVRLPAAGDLTVAATTARSRPNPSASRVLVVHRFRSDFRWQVVLAVGSKLGSDGRLWYEVSLPTRPNNTLGWMPADTLSLHTVTNRILVNRAHRWIEVLRGSRVLLKAVVAVGAPGMETPLGHFYVQARFVPDDPFFGVFALETSAYSNLSDWPGGGVVGIHGTSRPDLLGQAVSHGCIRVSNATAGALRRLAPVGTPIEVVAG